MDPCARSGCPGHIDDDGFCDHCGAPAPVGAVAAPAPPAVPSTGPPAGPAPRLPATPEGGAEGRPCQQPGCSGVYDDDDCCDSCGATFVPTRGSADTPPSISASTAPDTATFRATSGQWASTGRTGSGGGRSGRSHLGAGLVDLASVPRRDPMSAVLADPQVPEHKRFCGRCNHRIGRTHEGRAARTEGFCPNCAKPYSLEPKLRPGDLINEQYQVAGCIAHGGLGWIYLAQNLNLSGRQGYRWVVLKGLLDSEDEAAMAAAVAERQFLTDVSHPNIVQIYDFVQHDGAGYIVMEYIGGESLRELLQRHRTEHGSALPVAEAIAYMVAILPAFAYLHAQGLLFCDFKPDNAIHTGALLTLIDLGGVRAIDDDESDLWGTPGYQAPEVPEVGASIASDLYTVARTLAMLGVSFAGFQDEKRYATRLPPASEVPLFARYDAFHRFLVKATAAEPASRFQTAEEMEEQLLGVLHQVVALDTGSSRPPTSLLFSGELANGAEAATWQCLPIPAVDPSDPEAGVLLATSAISGLDQIRAILEATPRSPEVAFRLAGSAIESGDFAQAEAELDSPEARGSWRAAWWRGVLELAAGRPMDAQSYFGGVMGQLPGELAPQLALAVSCELAALGNAAVGDRPGNGSTNGRPPPGASPDDLRRAAHYYEAVARTDPGFASASFGLSRVRTALGERAGAVDALRRIPGSSSSHAAAQLALCRILSSDVAGRRPDLADLVTAATLIEQLKAEPTVRLTLARDLQAQALILLVDQAVAPDAQVTLAGGPLTEDGMRGALEATYRALARLARTDDERFALVDLANANRPRSLT